MLYGLYLSASGVQTNSYRQDVIANNIANAETVGFKRDLALIQERHTELRAGGFAPSRSNALLEALGGGIFASPTLVDRSQGELEQTGRVLDVSIAGQGYFKVANGDKVNLTRNGQFTINQRGRLALANNENYEVLDMKGKPIQLDNTRDIEIGPDGTITQKGLGPIARMSVVDVPDPTQIVKAGGTLLTYGDMTKTRPATGYDIKSGYKEMANVDPATELASLMDAQRQLEANANMIRYQDQMLSKLCNEVGKIS